MRSFRTQIKEKYGKEFVFEDYDGGGLLYNEELKVHPEDDRDCQVTLTISNATGKYRDNYAWLYYEDMYCNMVLDFIGDTLNNYNVKIYVDYAEINPEKIGMDLEKDEVKIHANLIIFINGTYDENEAVELTQEFIEWQKLRGFSGSSSLCVINRNSEWINISEYNYDVYIREKANLTVDFLLSKEGEVKIEIRGE